VVEAASVDYAHQTADNAQNNIGDELHGPAERGNDAAAEDRSPSIPGSEYAIAYNGRNERWQKSFILKIAAIKDLHAEDGPTQWGLEDGANPSSDSGCHGNAPVGL